MCGLTNAERGHSRRYQSHANLQKNQKKIQEEKTDGGSRCQNRNKETDFLSPSFLPPSVHLDIHTFSGIGCDCEGLAPSDVKPDKQISQHGHCCGVRGSLCCTNASQKSLYDYTHS